MNKTKILQILTSFLLFTGGRVQADWNLRTLASFNGANGTNPEAGVTIDADGNLYGTTTFGDASRPYGTVWEIAKGSNEITTIASFNYTNGAYPEAGVTLDRAGNLFGTTFGDSSNYGTVWEIAKGSNEITTIASFNLSNGAGPNGGVTLDSAGNLYGTTTGGGNLSGYGTVWEIVKGSNTITTLFTFNDLNKNGANPARRRRESLRYDGPRRRFARRYGLEDRSGVKRAYDPRLVQRKQWAPPNKQCDARRQREPLWHGS